MRHGVELGECIADGVFGSLSCWAVLHGGAE